MRMQIVAGDKRGGVKKPRCDTLIRIKVKVAERQLILMETIDFNAKFFVNHSGELTHGKLFFK